jgi:CubicO group peptidase (beta-lactamase class C family)
METSRDAVPGTLARERTPASQGVDPKGLEEAIADLERNAGRDGVRELVILRNGHLIWKGSDIDKVHGVWSCTKSFTSTVLGLLIDDGKCALDDPAHKHLPVLASRYGGVTLRHFTTMTSGYRAVGDEPQGSYIHGPSTTWFTPADAPLFTPPGSCYAYWDSAMNQFGNVLTRIAGEPLKELFRRRIANPIGMNPDAWTWGDFGRVDGLVVNGGSGNHGKHIQISARELARFGQLFLGEGEWHGRRLLSAKWVRAATSPQVPASVPLKGAAIDGRGVYGYNWWANGLTASGARKWPGAPVGTFAAIGHNNNRLFVIPEWQMVIVRLGLDQDTKELTDAASSSFLAKVGAALRKG